MILLIDNYDSFVFNLARYFERLGLETQVVRNDAIDSAGVRRLRPQAVVLSPGPCTPDRAGCSLEVVRRLSGEFPLLGVCLGHQTIGQAFGAKVVRASEPMHGRTSDIFHHGDGIYAGLPSPLTVCRYHSLVLDPESIPDELQVQSRTGDGAIMGIAHRSLPVVGVQFHPEAILTEHGYSMLARFLQIAGISTGGSQPLPLGELRTPASAANMLPSVPVTF